MHVRDSPVSGKGGFTVRDVEIGDVLALLTSQTHARTLEGHIVLSILAHCTAAHC